jgi:hypothetical protein
MKKVLIICSYFHLSYPIYSALKTLCAEHCVHLYYPKDINGTLANISSTDRLKLISDDVFYSELSYDPPWFVKNPGIANSNGFYSKLFKWIPYVKHLNKYKNTVAHDIKKIDPDLIILLTDMMFSARIIGNMLPNTKKIILQPAFLDIRPNKKVGFNLIKRCANMVVPMLFEKQPYYGFECESLNLYIWGTSTSKFYSKRNNVYKIVNPVLKELYLGNRNVLRCALNDGKFSVVFFISDFEFTYGSEFQHYYESQIYIFLNTISLAYDVKLKLHPTSNFESWSMRLGMNVERGNYELLQYVDMTSLYQSCDIAVVTNSYAAIEAMAHGSLVINFLPVIDSFRGDIDVDVDIDAACYARVTATAYELIKAVDDLMNVKEFINASIKCNDRYIKSYISPENTITIESAISEFLAKI